MLLLFGGYLFQSKNRRQPGDDPSNQRAEKGTGHAPENIHPVSPAVRKEELECFERYAEQTCGDKYAEGDAPPTVASD